MRIIFYILSGLFILLILDGYICRVSDTSDRVSYFTYQQVNARREHYTTPTLHTMKGKSILMPENKDFGYTSICPMTIKNGFFFRKPEEVDLTYEGIVTTYYCGITNRTSGDMMLTILVTCLMLYLFYEIIQKKKMNPQVFYSFCGLLVFFLYMFLIS